MHEKTRDIMRSYVAGKIDRRDLFKAMGKLGVGAAAASYLLNEASTQALAADFDWMAYKGKTINLLLNKHPYADAMIAYIDNFKKLTGMDVKYDVFPEDVYFDKVTAALSSGSSQYDAFMTGAYQTWQYGPAGWLVDMNEYLQDSSKTAPNYNWDGMLPNLRAATSWSGAARGGAGRRGCQAVGPAVGLRGLRALVQPEVPRPDEGAAAQGPAEPDGAGAEVLQGHAGRVRHRRARLALVGDDPSGLSLRLHQLRRARLHHGRRQAQGGDEQPPGQGDDSVVGQDDPGGRGRATGPPTLGTRSARTSVPAPVR